MLRDFDGIDSRVRYTGCRLDEGTYEKLHQMAQATDRTASAVLRLLIRRAEVRGDELVVGAK